MRAQLCNWVGCLPRYYLQGIEKIGRGEWIRTTGLLVPNQALYQAEPRPEHKHRQDACDSF
jgi:hypothetical protein